MPSQQMLEEEAEHIQDELHEWDDVDGFITVGELQEEANVDRQEQLTEELQRIKDVLVESDGVDKEIRIALERYVSLENDEPLPVINSYTGEISKINYDTTLQWVNNKLATNKQEEADLKLGYLRAGISWIASTLEQSQEAREECNRLTQALFKLDDSVANKVGMVDFEQMLKAQDALVNFAIRCKIEPEKINFIANGYPRTFNVKRHVIKEITNTILERNLSLFIYKILLESEFNYTATHKFDATLKAIDKVCSNLEQMKLGEIKAFEIDDIDFDALRADNISNDIHSMTTDSVLPLIDPFNMDKFRSCTLLDEQIYEITDDVSSLRNVTEKLPEVIDLNDGNVLSILNQINSIIADIIDSLKICYDVINKAVEYLTVKERVMLEFVMYIQEVEDATQDTTA